MSKALWLIKGVSSARLSTIHMQGPMGKEMRPKELDRISLGPLTELFTSTQEVESTECSFSACEPRGSRPSQDTRRKLSIDIETRIRLG